VGYVLVGGLASSIGGEKIYNSTTNIFVVVVGVCAPNALQVHLPLSGGYVMLCYYPLMVTHSAFIVVLK